MRLPALYGLLFLASLGCRSDRNANQPGLRSVIVREQVFTNSQAALPLQTVPFGIYINGGLRGIILLKDPQGSNTYTAFERNCPWRPDDACATVTLHPSGSYLEDTCCGSRWDRSGAPIGGPTTQRLLQYQATFQAPNVVWVVN